MGKEVKEQNRLASLTSLLREEGGGVPEDLKERVLREVAGEIARHTQGLLTAEEVLLLWRTFVKVLQKTATRHGVRVAVSWTWSSSRRKEEDPLEVLKKGFEGKGQGQDGQKS